MTRREGRSAAHDVFLNLAGQGLPLAVALATVPATVAGLGPERFGLLALALATLGVSTILDVSLGRAVTKHAAEAIARGERDRVGPVLRGGLALQAGVGLAFSLAVFAAAPALLRRGLKVPAVTVPDALLAFRLLAAATLPNLVIGGFRGILEALRRFDLVNLLRAPGGALTFLLPWAGARLGWSLSGIALALLLARAALLVAFAATALATGGDLLRGRGTKPFPVARFAGWATAADAIPAAVAAWDQFLIGAFVSLASVSTFAVPNEMVLRLWVVPMSVVAAFFPVLAAAWARADEAGAVRAGRRAAAGVLLLVGGPVLVLLLFAPRLLGLWMGPDFAAGAAPVLRVLAAGMFFGSFSLISASFLQAAGRPDTPAKVRLAELPVWLFGQWFLTRRWGLAGAAAGVALRSGLDALLVSAAAWRAARSARP